MFLRIKKRMKDMRIFNKMFLSCLLVTLLISLISGGITYYIASGIILKKTVMQTEEIIKQISENYDSFMKLIYNKLDYLSFNPTVQEELIYGKPGEDEEGYYSGTRKLKRLMVQMFNSIHMEDMEIYGENGKEYFCSILYQAPDLPNTEELKQTARERMGAIVCVNDIGTSGSLQVVKEIKDILSMQSLGILRTSIRLSALERIQHNVDFASSGKIILLDDNNEIILGEPSELTDRADDLFVKWDDSFRYEIDNAPYQVVYQVSEYTGWKTIGILPDKEISKSIMPLQTGTAVAAVLGILLSLALSVIMSYLLVRPITSTVGALKKFSKGDFKVRLEEERKDEFGEMNQVFNSTIQKVEKLLEEIAHSRVLNKEMEFKALQAQINPHFLYNALDTINWMAHKEGKDDICDMITAVSSLLRISISNKEAVFTVEKELRYVKDYLYIQKTRYRDRFEVIFDIEPEIYGQLIPKLTIQPLVENAIVHSVEVSREKAELTVEGHREGETVFIRVSDTGVGMTEETRKALLAEPGGADRQDINTAHTGLGVYAVHQRLKYLFGEGYGLTIQSSPGKGTCITIRIPFQMSTDEVYARAENLVERGPEDGFESSDS
ncbi:cache domain-containing sensor histidine kinase [Blautia sp.]|uniref:cache domain-containing sensor histidine kinase n=1 Tax=Blautia sp. TaxID=1955243 RepID=UPI00258AAE34|nr:sensor histidine kinase [Blautia sp.]